MKRAAGLSTLEALCALMVFNVLGIGVLHGQWQAMQAQREALAAQAAVDLAQDLWHRMQLNPSALGSYQLALGQVAQGPDCHAQPCDASQWAQADLADWQQELQVRLPGAQVQLATTLGPALPGPSTSPSWPATVTLRMHWPSRLPATPSCPEQQRCWQTTWSL